MRHTPITAWLSERIPLIYTLKQFLQQKSVPRHKYTFFYLFGGLSLFLFCTQIITGILLAIYYSPHPDSANESVRRIINEVSFGWVVRSIHSWGANFMVAVVLIHMFSTYFMQAYRKPREVMWMSGVVIFFLVLGFVFTGYLLPWDTTSYFATLIGTEIPKSIPIIGNVVVSLLRGENEVGIEALKRMYIIHILILPIISLLLIVFHIILQQSLGVSTPIGFKENLPQIPFLPNFLYRDFLTWTFTLSILLGMALMLPTALGVKADPLASAPMGIRPEWYFLPLYQTIRMFPTTAATLTGEMLVSILLIAGMTAWLFVPFLDRQAAREQKSVQFTFLGVVILLYCLVTIALGYWT